MSAAAENRNSIPYGGAIAHAMQNMREHCLENGEPVCDRCQLTLDALRALAGLVAEAEQHLHREYPSHSRYVLAMRELLDRFAAGFPPAATEGE